MDGSVAFEPRELYSGRPGTFAGTGTDLAFKSTVAGQGHPVSTSYFSVPTSQPPICSVESVIVTAVGAGGICGLNEGITSSITYDRWLYIDPTGRPVFYIYDGAIKKAVGSASLTANIVYHLCGTSDGSNIRLYVSGQLVATTATANGGYAAYSNPCFMVNHAHITPDSSTTFGGSILFTQFANVAWSDSEVRRRAEAPYQHMYNSEDWLMSCLSTGQGASPPGGGGGGSFNRAVTVIT